MRTYVLIIVFISFIFSSCKKEDPEPDPVACFTLSSTLVDINEVVISSNCSRNAYSYQWSDGDGNQTTISEPTFYYSEPGDYLVSLTAYSENGSKNHTVQETITVMQMYGSVSFWLSGTPAYGITTVTVDGLSRQITSYYSSGISGCDWEGCANFTLPTGTHSFYATDNIYEWNGTVTIETNTCLILQLQ